MIRGKCRTCGKYYYGYALMYPETRVCDGCGGKIVTEEPEAEGHTTGDGGVSPGHYAGNAIAGKEQKEKAAHKPLP